MCIIFSVALQSAALGTQALLDRDSYPSRIHIVPCGLEIVPSALLLLQVPKYKDKHVLVYLMLCSVISSVTVVSCRCHGGVRVLQLQGREGRPW
jgi:hypothetical protein